MIARSLRIRFLVTTIPTMLVLVLGSIAGFDWIICGIVNGLSERFAVKQVYFDRSRTLSPLLQEMALARKMVRSPVIVEWAANEADPAVAARGLAEIESFREAFRDGSYFFAIRKSGHYYFNDSQNTYAGRQLRYSLSETEDKDSWYYATLKNPKECQLNVNLDNELGTTKIWINCLVRRDGEVIGLAGTGIDLHNFISSILDPRHEGAVSMFIDGDGAIQAHPDIGKIDFHTITKDPSTKKTVSRLITDDASRKRLEQLLASLKRAPETPQTAYLTINGKKTLVGAAYLKEIGWYNLTLLDPRVWTLDQSFWPLAALMVAGMLLTLAFVAMFIDRLVLSRIDRLDRAVRGIKDDHYRLDLHDDLPDEIGRLTNGFTEMARVVQRNRLELEDKVAERTRELVDARDEAEAANRAKSDFLAMMSHDLRTPLNAIIGFSDMIRAGTFGPLGNDRYAAYLDDIHASGHLLLSLINVLLDISKIEAGKLELLETETDVPTFLGDLVRQIEPIASESRVRVTVAAVPGLPRLRCDQRSLAQIVNNLISNAVKFSNAGQTVEVAAHADPADGYVIRVTDVGIGMDADDIKKALEPFAQVKSERSRNLDGTGLGLHVSRLLMAAHGGRLEIASEPGQGTTVTVTFPPERIVAGTPGRT